MLKTILEGKEKVIFATAYIFNGKAVMWNMNILRKIS